MSSNTNNSKDLKITFYSTSNKEESKSKYPKQFRTSYTVCEGETEINIAKKLLIHNTKIASRSESKEYNKKIKDEDTSKNSENDDCKESNDFETQSDENIMHIPKDETIKKDDQYILSQSRGKRVHKKPQRYEPTERVTDDFDD
jgi:hypothetical protein